MAMRMQVNETHNSLPEIAVVLGRSERLSMHEIRSTLARSGRRIDDCTVTSGIALVKALPVPDSEWFALLGGSIKFGVVVGQSMTSPDELLRLLEHAIGESPMIGLSVIGGKLDAGVIASGMKKKIMTLRRFIVSGDGKLLSAAQSKGIVAEKGSEWLILVVGNSFRLIRIKAVQDIDDLTRRDRELPVADAKRGMLPTKLARMMVNIALGDSVMGDEAPLLLDPFCGTGRTLIEAKLVGADILGADIDSVAVDASRQNLAWAVETYHLAGYDSEQLQTVSIEKLGRLFSPHSIDAIATEPYLGPPMHRLPTTVEREQLFHQLIPSYEALLRAGQLLLKPGSRLVVVFPQIGEQSLFGLFVDRLLGFGYHLLDSIPVTRPDQLIARDIVLLRK